MRGLDPWLTEYGASHRNGTNKLLHRICVPLIVLSIAGLLWDLPVPQKVAALFPWLNWATLITALAVLYYLVLCPALALGAAAAFTVCFLVIVGLAQLPWPLWISSLVIFVLAWMGQFVGHAIEGSRPSFFKDLQFLMIGPLWLLAQLYRRLGIFY